MKKVVFTLICLLAASCSSYTEEEKIFNVLMMNEYESEITITEIEPTPKTRYCYPFAAMRVLQSYTSSTFYEDRKRVYERFREDSIAGYPGTEHGLPSKIVKYTLGNGEKKHAVVYFGKGEQIVTATLGMYKLCH